MCRIKHFIIAILTVLLLSLTGCELESKANLYGLLNYQNGYTDAEDTVLTGPPITIEELENAEEVIENGPPIWD